VEATKNVSSNQESTPDTTVEPEKNVTDNRPDKTDVGSDEFCRA